MIVLFEGPSFLRRKLEYVPHDWYVKTIFSHPGADLNLILNFIRVRSGWGTGENIFLGISSRFLTAHGLFHALGGEKVGDTGPLVCVRIGVGVSVRSCQARE